MDQEVLDSSRPGPEYQQGQKEVWGSHSREHMSGTLSDLGQQVMLCQAATHGPQQGTTDLRGAGMLPQPL